MTNATVFPGSSDFAGVFPVMPLRSPEKAEEHLETGFWSNGDVERPCKRFIPQLDRKSNAEEASVR